MVQHAHLRLPVVALHHHRDLALAVAARVFKQVAQGPAQQLGHAPHLQRLEAGTDVEVGAHAGAFLRGQPDQIDQFHGAHVGLARIQAAGQQNFVDQLVEFGDVAQDFFAERRRRLLPAHQFQPHADARERRAKFVRCVGQQRFVRLDQCLDAGRRRVELACQVGHFVLPLLGHPHRKIAFAKSLHAALQGFKPLQQAADDGEHPHGHGQAHQGQHPHEAEGRASPEGGVGTPVGPRVAPAGARCHLQAVCGSVGAVDAELQPLVGRPGLARGKPGNQDVAVGIAQHHFTRWRGQGLRILLGRNAPGPAHGQREHGHAADHGQPDAQVQAAGKKIKHRHSPHWWTAARAWGAASARAAVQGPPRRMGGAPLPAARSVARAGGRRAAPRGCVSRQSCCLANT